MREVHVNPESTSRYNRVVRTSALLRAEEFARVADVLDKSWTETEEKIDEYHAAGVDLVWVLDPRTQTLRAYGRGASPVLLHGSDAASADPLVPGFSCRVADFFAG